MRFIIILLLSFGSLTFNGWTSGCSGGSSGETADADGGGGGGVEEGGNTTDTTAPTVSAVTPTSGATSVSNNNATTSVTATFSEAVTGVSSSTFTVTDPLGNAIAGTVTYDSTNNRATFTPTSRLALIAQYTATLSASIADASSNTLGSNYSWSFTTRDGSWGTRTDRDGLIGTASNTQVGLDNSGNATAIWRENEGGGAYYIFEVGGNIFTDTWSVVNDVESVGGSTSPDLAVSDAGNIMSVWVQPESAGGTDSIRANRLVGSWAAYTDYTGGFLESLGGATTIPQVAAIDNGDSIAVWVRTGNRIWANYYEADAAGWTAGDAANIDEAATSITPQVAMADNGNAVAIWETDGQVNGRTLSYNAGDFTLGTIQSISSSTDTSVPQIAMNATGNALVVWIQGGGLYYNYYSNSSWGGATSMNTTGTHTEPQVVMNDSGISMVISNRTSSLLLVRYTPTGSTEYTIACTACATPQIAMDNYGNAIAVWVDGDGLYYSRYVRSSDTWGTPVDISGAATAFAPQISMDDNGNAAVAWIEDSDLYMNTFR